MPHYQSLVHQSTDSSIAATEVYSPYSGELVGTVETSSAENVERALTTAHKLFQNKSSWLTVEKRCAVLEKTAALMQERFEHLVTIAASEGGKPWVDSEVEVKRAIDGVKICIETIRTEHGNVIPMSEPQKKFGRMAFTQKEPIGVVVAFSAFNHPLNLIVHQAGAAVAAGCPAIIKPAANTPLSCFEFVKILHEAGLPPEWCQALLPESRALSTSMATDPRVGFFTFIGSGAVGWKLNSQLSPGTRSALEHGGVAPVVVDKSASIAKLIPSILKGGFYHAGQVCVSVQRVYLHESQIDEVTAQLKAGAEKLVVGDSLDPKTEVGPLIRPSEVDRVDQWVNEAVEAGATLLTGGKKLPNNCYAPTLLLNPPADAQVSQKEVFGPVICLYSYSEIDQAIDSANSLEVAFQAAVFAQDIDRAIEIAHKLDASAVMINDNTAFRQDGMPFAGLRESGLGIGGVPFTIEDMQIDKMLVIRSTFES